MTPSAPVPKVIIKKQINSRENRLREVASRHSRERARRRRGFRGCRGSAGCGRSSVHEHHVRISSGVSLVGVVIVGPAVITVQFNCGAFITGSKVVCAAARLSLCARN